MTLYFPGGLPLSVYGLPPRVQDLHKRVKRFIDKEVIPFEREWLKYNEDPKTKWTIHPHVEELKVMESRRIRPLDVTM